MTRDLMPSGRPLPLLSDMTCPHCGEVGSRVINTRGAIYDGRQIVRRRRKCSSCGAKFSTMEIYAERGAMDGRLLVPDDELFRAAVKRKAIALIRKLIEETDR